MHRAYLVSGEKLRPMVVLHRLLGNPVDGFACLRPGVGLLLLEEGLDVAAHHGSLSEADDAAVVTSPSYSSSRGRAPPRVAVGGSLPEAIVPHCDDARWVTGSLAAMRNMLQRPGRAEEPTGWPRSPPLMASAVTVPQSPSRGMYYACDPDYCAGDLDQEGGGPFM